MTGIVVDGLSKTYSGASEPALDDVSLIVKPGQVFGLLGPNGAGKSSLIGACTTRVLPSAGVVRVDDIDVASDPVAAKRQIGVVAQHNTLDRSVSVWENLYLHCRYFGIDRRDAAARSDQLLQTFALTDLRERLIPTLSGGQARRLQLARALAHRPAAVFLDEPTVGLDPQSRQLLWTLTRQLRDEDVAVLLTTHDMEEADQLCDTLAIIDHGHLIAEGTPGELKARVGADTVISLTVRADRDRLAAELAELPAVHSVNHHSPGRLGVLAATGESTVAAVVAAAVPYGLLGVAVKPVTLETVFLNLTGRQLRD
ncbi:MAG: ABC transporter ATP-binding protein [Solirubrobacteraceae bacterium]